MKKQIIVLCEFYDILKAVDEHFGICIPYISNWILNYETCPDDMKAFRYVLPEYIAWDTVGQLFIRYHLNPEGDWWRHQAVIWILANMYYGDSYNEHLNSVHSSDESIMSLRAEISRREIAKVYWALKSNEDAVRDIRNQYKKWEDEWKNETKAHWNQRKESIRKELEKAWGKEYVNGRSWKLVEKLILKERDALVEKEINEAIKLREEYKEYERQKKALTTITLSVGGFKVNLDNRIEWFNDLCNNQLFPHTIPDICTKEQAKEIADPPKPRGRKPEDPRIRAVVYGVSQYFYQEHLVESHTAKNLQGFTCELLKLMDIRGDKGAFLSPKQVGDLMDNLPNAKNDPSFFSTGWTSCSIESLMNEIVDPFNWLWPSTTPVQQ